MSDKMIIENGQVTLVTDEGRKVELPEERLVEMIRRETEPPIDGEAWPDGIKFCQWQPPYFCVVHQLPAHVRQLRWITDDSPVPYGPGTKFQTRRLSLPYSVTFAVYCQRGSQLSLTGCNELYFRNAPLKRRTDRLGYPALLNVSRIDAGGRSRAWICTQHLRCRPDRGWDAQLAALLDHTFNGAFNLSSEHHEGASWYGESRGIHKDLHPIARWEQASAKNDAFALQVAWKAVPLNVAQLMTAMLDECQQTASGRLPVRRRSAANRPGLATRFLNYSQKLKPQTDKQ